MKFLIIQTAFIGDVILATPLIESLKKDNPENRVDFLLRKGNEVLLADHPKVDRLYVWDKERKYKDMRRLIKEIRAEKYDVAFNLQRFGTMGYLTYRSGAKQKIGFDKNPFSFTYTLSIKHEIGNGKHEVDRNLELISRHSEVALRQPKLYIDSWKQKVKHLQQDPFVCVAPASVWYTKQFQPNQWISLIDAIPKKHRVYLLGSKADKPLCDKISDSSTHGKIEVLAGQLNLMESAALMEKAAMNYVNDSAPLHLCSAVNAPVTGVFCSTIPDFGFTPLSENSSIVQSLEELECRPCGIHGFDQCPKGHFKCSSTIKTEQFPLPQ